jgi:hypothetical protein
METKHTEGWISKYRFAKRTDTTIEVKDDGGFIIARIPRYGRSEPNAHKQETQEANAALIEAAPSLLKLAVAYRNHLRTAASTEEDVATYEHACAVIAAATGQQ